MRSVNEYQRWWPYEPYLFISLTIDYSVTSKLLDNSLVGAYEPYPYFLKKPPSIIKLLCNSEVTVIFPDINYNQATLTFDSHEEISINVISNKEV